MKSISFVLALLLSNVIAAPAGNTFTALEARDESTVINAVLRGIEVKRSDKPTMRHVHANSEAREKRAALTAVSKLERRKETGIVARGDAVNAASESVCGVLDMASGLLGNILSAGLEVEASVRVDANLLLGALTGTVTNTGQTATGATGDLLSGVNNLLSGIAEGLLSGHASTTNQNQIVNGLTGTLTGLTNGVLGEGVSNAVGGAGGVSGVNTGNSGSNNGNSGSSNGNSGSLLGGLNLGALLAPQTTQGGNPANIVSSLTTAFGGVENLGLFTAALTDAALKGLKINVQALNNVLNGDQCTCVAAKRDVLEERHVSGAAPTKRSENSKLTLMPMFRLPLTNFPAPVLIVIRDMVVHIAAAIPELKADSQSLVQIVENIHKALSNRIHRRIVLRDYGLPIYKASSRSALLAGLEGCINGHESLHAAGLLHRDISINNLMINENSDNSSWPAFLIDLDLSVKVHRDSPSGAKGKTGTRASMAIGVLLNEQHSFMHDLESFFWVFFWTCIHYTGPGQGRIVPQFDKWNFLDTEELAIYKRGTIASERAFIRIAETNFTV
ncbi:hypothetical protein EDB81DRAFT_752271 [Dactylonectria macrodidyma]|uniref:non-specific serine/threonine protein kinase n=1 Tax=Dactylonectria macrodidyma TaxID=307937 RepID=A0A9P9FVT3_9HYPO|nr:hypothetical protein EDB81DRAFT_752271 [Dactylonectria macrodidyma]